MADSHSDRARSVGIDMRGFRVQPNNDRISTRKRTKNRTEIHCTIYKKTSENHPENVKKTTPESSTKNIKNAKLIEKQISSRINNSDRNFVRMNLHAKITHVQSSTTKFQTTIHQKSSTFYALMGWL